MPAERLVIRLTAHSNQDNLKAVWSVATRKFDSGKAARHVAAEQLVIRLTTHSNPGQISKRFGA
jgi:hypothetical protein